MVSIQVNESNSKHSPKLFVFLSELGKVFPKSCKTSKYIYKVAEFSQISNFTGRKIPKKVKIK